MADKVGTADSTKGLIPMGKFCELVGLSNQRVLDMIKDGTIKSYKLIKGKHWLGLWAVNEYITFLRNYHNETNKNRKPAELEKEKLQADVDYKQAKARMVEMQCEELAGRMHDSDVVETVMNDFIYYVKNALLALPGRMAVDLVNALSPYFKKKPLPAVISDEMKKELEIILMEFTRYKYDPKRMVDLTREKLKKDALVDNNEEEDSE